MRAKAVAIRILAFVLVGLGAIFVSSPDPSQGSHDARFVDTTYFVLAFIEDVPNTPLALVRVADCETQSHYHASIITAAVARWNATNRVRFVYDTQQPTVPCDVSGYPNITNVVSVIHDSSVPTGDFQAQQSFDSFRNNDWGPESSAGMYPMTKVRIRLGDSYDTTGGLAHELGHATGLADLYVPGSNPCVNDNPYGGQTVMDCTTNHDPIPQVIDIDSLNLMYRRIPQTIPAGGANWRITGRTATSVSFAWTDYSFNERDQLIGQDNDNNGVNEGLPISIARDLESATWAGLPGAKFYCFNIAQRNAYGDAAAKSPNVCGSTTGVEPSNVRVCSVPCDLFGFKDNASNETGFGVIVQKRTSCSSGSWSTVDQFLLPPKSGTDDVYAYNFVGPGCFRVRVQALGAGGATSNLVSSSGIYFPN